MLKPSPAAAASNCCSDGSSSGGCEQLCRQQNPTKSNHAKKRKTPKQPSAKNPAPYATARPPTLCDICLQHDSLSPLTPPTHLTKRICVAATVNAHARQWIVKPLAVAAAASTACTELRRTLRLGTARPHGNSKGPTGIATNTLSLHALHTALAQHIPPTQNNKYFSSPPRVPRCWLLLLRVPAADSSKAAV